jgi:TRAP-type mannitol/chloroaromatic compound transport system permease large subunit
MKQFVLLLIVLGVLFIVLATDTHKTAIGFVWPYLVAFADYQAR